MNPEWSQVELAWSLHVERCNRREIAEYLGVSIEGVNWLLDCARIALGYVPMRRRQ